MPKISQLPAAVSVGSADLIPIVQGGSTKKAALSLPFTFGGELTLSAGNLTLSAGSLFVNGASGNAAIVGRGEITFSGTVDHVSIFGYNIDKTGAVITDAADTAIMLDLESNYNDGSIRHAEIHFNIASPGQSFVRPFAVDYHLTGASANKINSVALQSWNTIELTCNELVLKDRTGVGTSNLSVDTNAFLTVTTNRLAVTGVGPHAIGGSPNTAAQLSLTGTFAGVGVSWGLYIATTHTVPVNGTGYGALFGPVLNKAGSGTHADFATLDLEPPTIGAGAATLTNASTLKITAAPSVGTNQRALWVVAGLSQFGGAIVVDTTAGNAIGIAASSTTTLALKDSSTGASSLRIPHGTAPSSPVNGDMWTTTSGLFVRINGSTVGPLS